jgi:hypothetical protein
MLANFVAAIGFYIQYTFRCRPPLTSEAANQGAMALPQPPSSLQLSSRLRLKALDGKSSPPTTPEAESSPIAEATAAVTAAVAKDTAAGCDQCPAGSVGHHCGFAGPLDGQGQREAATIPAPSFGQRMCSLGSSVAAKIRGDIWEDENFR